MNKKQSIFFTLFFLIKCYLCQYTDDCFDYNSKGTYGCFVFPTGCKNSNCSFVFKWQDKSSYLNFKLIAYVKTINIESAYAAIGFSYDNMMGNDSVVMCRVLNRSNIMAVESYYNNGYKSDTVDPQNRTIGLFDSSISLNDSRLICNFSRLKSISNLSKYFFDLNNPFKILVAYGETNSLASPIYHGPHAESSVNEQNFQSLKSADFNI